MADLLIYRGPHPWDNYSGAEIDAKELEHPGFRAKWERRTQRGDVIEVQPDGRYSDSYKHKLFALVRVPGLSVKAAEGYLGRWEPGVTTVLPVDGRPNEYDIYPDTDIPEWFTLRKHLMVDDIVERTSGRIRVRLDPAIILSDFMLHPETYLLGLNMPKQKHRFQLNITSLSPTKEAEFQAGKVVLTEQECDVVDKKG